MVIKKVIIDKANRLYQLPPGIMRFLAPQSRRGLLKRTELLDLASFNWPVSFESLRASEVSPMQPAPAEKINLLKEELAGWYQAVHGVRLLPTKEIYVGGGISNILFSLALAFVDHGDIAFVPDLGVPLYRTVVTACGGEAVSYTISAKDGWLPDFGRVGTRLGRVARILFLNSPHNPTGADLNEKQMSDLVWIAGRENIMVVNDAAYQNYPERRIISLMGVPGGRKVGVEVGSFAYHFGLPPLPCGFAVGNRDVISGLKEADRLSPSVLPEFYVDLVLNAIRRYPGDGLRHVRRETDRSVAEARKLLEQQGLEKVGLNGVPYGWARIERRQSSTHAANQFYKRCRILVAPGTGFGESGEGYLRFSLTASPDVYREARERLSKKRLLTSLSRKK